MAQSDTRQQAADEVLADPRLSAFGLEHASTGFFLVDCEANILRVNEATCRMIGYPRAELTGLTVPDVNPEFPAEVWPPHWEELRRKKYMCFESVLQHKEGHCFPVEIEINYLAFEGAEYNFAFVRDISARSEAEQKLRDHEALLQAVTNDAHVGLVLVDRSFQCVYANSGFTELLGLSEDPAGKGAAEVFGSLFEQVRSNIERAMSGECVGHELCLPEGPDGEADRHLHITCQRRNADETQAGVVIVITDITATVVAAQEREEMERRFQETQKLESLGVLAGGIAHDFNNLLTAMLGNVSLMKMQLASNSPHNELLTDVENAAIRAADLCKQMLAYAGKGKFVLRRLDLSELTRELASLLEVSISKSIHLDLQLAENLPAVKADAAQLHQVVLNLVINSAEAIGERQGTITVATGALWADQRYLESNNFACDLKPGRYVFLEIGDNGPGMSSETKARIFEPFFTTKFTGRGLGLAAVQGIVRGHHGTMRVYSESGSGTVFKILLPAAADDTSLLEPQEAEPHQLPAGETVLVVDDESHVRQTVERVLTSNGHRVLLACDGEQGVARFNEHSDQIDLVLLDLTMPGLNGVEAFREIRLARPDVRVLLMSGYNEQTAVQRFTGKGLAGFIQKPFLANQLLRAIGEAISGGAASV